MYVCVYSTLQWKINLSICFNVIIWYDNVQYVACALCPMRSLREQRTDGSWTFCCLLTNLTHLTHHFHSCWFDNVCIWHQSSKVQNLDSDLFYRVYITFIIFAMPITSHFLHTCYSLQLLNPHHFLYSLLTQLSNELDLTHKHTLNTLLLQTDGILYSLKSNY